MLPVRVLQVHVLLDRDLPVHFFLLVQSSPVQFAKYLMPFSNTKGEFTEKGRNLITEAYFQGPYVEFSIRFEIGLSLLQ